MSSVAKRKKKIPAEKILELYDSHGISPEQLKRRALEKNIEVETPSNFYSDIASRHEKKIEKEEKREEITEYPETKLLFYDDWKMREFDAEVVGVEDEWIVLNRTSFYPESGGQATDLGTINGVKVLEVKKIGRVVLHKTPGKYTTGQTIHGEINWERRLHLTRHHTAAHIINGAARRILGNHVWQAGAEKRVEQARLDIAHYESLDRKEIIEIENLANEIVLEGRPIKKSFMKRSDAEKEYGFRLYQGGAVPGKMIRVIDIEDFDVEACGGTHCDSTSEVGFIKILRTEKIQDDVVRLEFAAGMKALAHMQEIEETLERAGSILRVQKDKIPLTTQRFFDEWKERGKEIERLTKELSELRVLQLKDAFTEKEGLKFLKREIEGDLDLLRKTALSLTEDETVIVLHNGKNLVCTCGKKAIERGYRANEYIKKFGKGGGNEEMAQGVKE